MMNIAFIGFRHSHIWGLYDLARKTPGVAIVGGCESDEASREIARERFAEPLYASPDILLNDPAVEAVAIGDYYGIRESIIVRALEKGKKVICDKPLCTSSDGLNRIRTLALEKKLTVACMLDLRYDGAVRTAKRIISDGRLGRLHAFAFTGQHPLNYGVRPMWYFEEGKHGGTINDIAIHGIDALRYMTGLDMIAPTAARTWNAFAHEKPDFRDCAQFMAEFDGHAGLIADVSYAAPGNLGWMLPGYWRFSLWGDDGWLEFRVGDDHVQIAVKGHESIETLPVEPVTDNYLLDFMKPFDAKETLFTLTSAQSTLALQALADSAFR